MSLTRRLAAGLPAVGVLALAALALAGTPANADPGAYAARPGIMATPCADDARIKCADGDAVGDGYGGYDDTAGDGTPNDTGTSAGPSSGTSAGDDTGTSAGDDDRGNPGYGGESPTPAPSLSSTPTGEANTVPGGNVGPATVAPSKPGGGVSAGGTLPVTGGSMTMTIAFGAVLVAGGSAAVWYSRRRRNA